MLPQPLPPVAPHLMRGLAFLFRHYDQERRLEKDGWICAECHEEIASAIAREKLVKK